MFYIVRDPSRLPKTSMPSLIPCLYFTACLLYTRCRSKTSYSVNDSLKSLEGSRRLWRGWAIPTREIEKVGRCWPERRRDSRLVARPRTVRPG